MKPGNLVSTLLVMIFLFSCNFLNNAEEQINVETIVSGTLNAFPQTVEPVKTGTVEPAPTALPTPLPVDVWHPSELRVAFIGPDRNLYAWTQTTGTKLILDTGNAVDIRISGDGALIAILREGQDFRTSLWIIGFDGSNLREVITWNDLTGLKTSTDSQGTSAVNMQWIPGTHQLAFTTRDLFEGPGLILNDDLLVVDGDTGRWGYRLASGKGGMAAFSPDGKWMAISTAEKISIMDLYGNPAPCLPLTFLPVMTYSEYMYYPQPVWAADGSRLAVVIPAADPLAEPRQPSSIWIMDTHSGNPVLQTQVIPQFLGPVSVSPDLQKFYYVRETGQPVENKREIRTAQINGQNESINFSGGIPIMHGWKMGSDAFAYQAASQLAVTVNSMDGSIRNLAGTEGAFWFRWVDESRFIYAKRTTGTVELHLGIEGEGSHLIAALPESEIFYLQIDYAR